MSEIINYDSLLIAITVQCKPSIENHLFRYEFTIDKFNEIVKESKKPHIVKDYKFTDFVSYIKLRYADKVNDHYIAGYVFNNDNYIIWIYK
jgi:hypothetical protein